MGFFEDLLSGIGLIPSDEEEALLGAGIEGSQTEAEAIRQRMAILNELQGLIRGASAGGAPPISRINLRNPEDPAALFGGIRPMADINAMFRLLGASGPTSGGAAANAASQGLGLQQRREENLRNLATLLIGGYGGYAADFGRDRFFGGGGG